LPRLVAVHVDHQLRPTSAEEGEKVAALLETWEIKNYVEQVDVPTIVAEEQLSVEEAARQARYQTLAAIARIEGAHFVLVGHHAGDQAETILMHIIRGSGLAGLRGMRPASVMPGAPEIKLLRPMLHIQRAEILAYCLNNHLLPIEDESNQDMRFLRNRVRHHLMPNLSEMNPQIENRLLDLGKVVDGDEEVMQRMTIRLLERLLRERGDGWLRLDLSQWRNLPPGAQRRILRLAVRGLLSSDVEISFATIEQARLLSMEGQVGQKSSLPSGVVMALEYVALALAVPGAAGPLPNAPQLPDEQAYPLPLPGKLALANGWQLAARRVKSPDLADVYANLDPWTAYIALPPDEELVARPRQEGEQFQPLGMDGASASLKKMMINRKMPAKLRPAWPIIATGEHLVWVVGHMLDERMKVTPGQKDVVIWKIICEQQP
jgi:tRNA(Ile)-lysidine synthase